MSEIQRINDGGNVGAILDYKDFLDKAKKSPRSVFNLSRLYSTTMDIGALVPVDCLKVLPGDKMTLSNDILVMGFNPTVKRMLDKCTIYVHYYYSRCNDLWKGWNNYITKGRSGKIALTLPKVSLGTIYDQTNNIYSTANTYGYFGKDEGLDTSSEDDNTAQKHAYQYSKPHSLATYLGVPMQFFDPEENETRYHLQGANINSPLPYLWNNLLHFGSALLTGSAQRRYGVITAKDDVNALPFAMYQRIFRDYYLNKNLVQDNTAWFPLDEDEFILPYNPTNGAVGVLGEQSQAKNVQINTGRNTPCFIVDNWCPKNTETTITYTVDGQNLITIKGFDTPALPVLRHRQWKLSEVMAGLPWQQRGDQLNLFSTNDIAIVDTYINAGGRNNLQPIVAGTAATGNTVDKGGIGYNNSLQKGTIPNVNTATYALTGTQALAISLAQLNITANAMRELFVLDQWQIMMAHTNGDYNELIEAQFGDNPRWRDRTPTYIGGTRQDLIFNEVLQTSEDGDTPLGTQAGRAVSAGTGYVGEFNVPDYGYIMAIASIIPDTTYSSQGMERWLKGGTSFADEYMPIFNNLAPEPILSNEISVTDSVDSLFAWRERYADYKTRTNKVTGWLALNARERADMQAYTFAQYYQEYGSDLNRKMTFNNDFVTASFPHVRRDMFSVPGEPMFLIQVANRVRAVRPIPVAVKPAGLNGVAM